MNRAQRRLAASILGLPPEEHAEMISIAFHRQMRPACSQCGAPVQWLGVGEALDSGADVNGFLDRMDLPPAQLDGLEFWRCVRCGEVGCLGGIEFE